MPKRNPNSHALRELAEGLIRGLAEEVEIPEDERRDLATSLVRQWITYDGRATLFLGGEQVYFILGRTPLGRFTLKPVPGLPGWLGQLTADWRIHPDALPEVFEQLNRAQSAEVINEDGVPLRLWVNPGEGKRGVDELVKQPGQTGRTRDYRKLAWNQLEQKFGAGLDEDEMDALACSVARQWQRYGGHACLFLPGKRLQFTLTEKADGGCVVTAEERAAGLESLLDSLGFPAEALADAVARINLGQEVEFRDQEGVPSLLWNDPQIQRILVRPLDPAAAGASGSLPPLLCPACHAVLGPWRAGEQQQRCPHCGNIVSLP